MAEGTKETNRYKESELIVGFFLFIFIDTAAFLMDWTGVGAVLIAPTMQGFGTLVQTMWARAKGDAGALRFGRQAVKYAANFLPWVPTLLLAFMIETYVHNHPKMVNLAEKAVNISGGAGKLAKSIKAA